MIIYFADRHLNILGQATTNLPQGLRITDDLKTEDIATGVSIFECDLHFDRETKAKAAEWAKVGNFILRSFGEEYEFYNILDTSNDSKKQKINIYAEDDGLDLINDLAGAYAADQPYPIRSYIERFAAGAGWEIGINEVEGLTRRLSWDSEQTASARLLKIAEAFGCEISFSFNIRGLQIIKKYINIFEKRGQDTGLQLRLNKEIDSIITTQSITNLATALKPTGGTPDNAEDAVTLRNYVYDNGDFYVDGEVLKSRKALEKWSRYHWRSDETEQSGGHIVKQFSSDTLSQAVLCEEAIAELKKICDTEINFEVDITKFPENLKIGDRVNIIDDAGNLYLSSRVLILETSVADNSRRAVLGEHLIRKNGISQKVADLAAEFAKQTVSVQNANKIANSAKVSAEAALEAAEGVADEAANALAVAQAAQGVSNTATEKATEAQQAANNAVSAVATVQQSVSGLQTTIDNAQAAADNAYTAAQTADAKAEEAKQAAENAVDDAADAKAAAEAADEKAETAKTNAATAINTASTAKAQAEAASATATAAKADAAQAEEDIAAFEENLETYKNTVSANYARKTDLTEATDSLQSQITQNAGQISSTITSVQRIDETANNAAEQAAQAQSTADSATTKANQAISDAQAAQAAADLSAQAAADAQAEADTAKAAAATAKSVADQAEADLAAAQADLATVTGRVDATEEDIEAAQQAVLTAQQAATAAQNNAATAVTNAANAQATADTAVDNAATAQAKAEAAATAAENAQAAAETAQGNATAAQNKANEAAATAAAAQTKANQAASTASAAQTVANEAAANAAAAQQAADDANAKAQQAKTDLATAQKNLADVTSRVDATEEEVEAAQSAVIAAQQAAENAVANATAAQTTANTAKDTATAAQTAANTAKTAADNAQAAADEAQAAAEAAQADVDALAVRVTSAETSITQNKNEIALRATKTEVKETLGGYYTKTQADAAITTKANEISSSVTATTNTADKTAADLGELLSDYTESKTLIQQLSDSISSLVTDKDGTSKMTQESGKWTFNISAIQDKLDQVVSDLGAFTLQIGNTDAAITALQDAVNSLGEVSEYVLIGTYEGEPCIWLGESDSDNKQLITNKKTIFFEGSDTPVFIENRTLTAEKIVVKDEFKQGNFVENIRSNGNKGLFWKEGVS